MTTTTVMLTLTSDADNMLYRFVRLVALPEATTCEDCDAVLEHVALEVSLDADFAYPIYLHPACLSNYDIARADDAV